MTHLSPAGSIEKNPKPRTRGIYVSALRSFIAWCRAHDITMPEDWRVKAVLPRRVPKQEPPHRLPAGSGSRHRLSLCPRRPSGGSSGLRRAVPGEHLQNDRRDFQAGLSTIQNETANVNHSHSALSWFFHMMSYEAKGCTSRNHGVYKAPTSKSGSSLGRSKYG